MILIQWPPQSLSAFTVRGRLFEWTGEEPFISLMRDGTVDNDEKRQTAGFINRVQRYGKQNSINESEWATSAIYSAISARIPAVLRAKFFRESKSSSPHPSTMNPHNAPVPPGLAEAAGFPAVADDDPDLPRALAGLTPEQWVATLKRWLKKDEEARKKKSVAGPAWWWAGHSVAKNPVASISPLLFIGLWLGSFPCRKCRIESRRYIASHPVPKWDAFEPWMDTFHQYVTERKNNSAPSPLR